jgi:AcrR family transcriptional regulator
MDPRERMVLSTIALLGRRGYQGTSFSEVLADSGAPRGSVYHHFPGGKDELVTAAIHRTVEIARDDLSAAHGKPLDDMLEDLCSWWRAILEQSACERGCPLMAVSSGAPEDSPLQDVVRDAFVEWEGAIADLLATAPEAPSTSGDLRETAVYLLGTLEGALAYGRATRSLERFDVLAATVRRSVPRLLST